MLGIDVESPALVTAGVVASVLVAGGLWMSQRRQIAVVAAVFGLAFVALDVTEVAHQLDESRAAWAAFAGLVAFGHAIATVASGTASLKPT